MSLQTGKETIYKQDFQTSLENANQPEWLKNLREEAFAYFTENGFPTVKNEDWKYTNVAPMAKADFQIADDSEFDERKYRAVYRGRIETERFGFYERRI